VSGPVDALFRNINALRGHWMTTTLPIAVLTHLAAPWSGTFRGRSALSNGVSRKQLGTLQQQGFIERVLPDTYRLTATPPSPDQMLCAALLWAGDRAVGDRRSAAMLYRLEGLRTHKPQIVVPSTVRRRSEDVDVRYYDDRRALMVRRIRGVPVTGIEATLMVLAHELDGVALEIACEDARRRRLTTIPALNTYVDRFGVSGRPGVAALRRLLSELDPMHPSRSTLEVLTRHLLAAHGIPGSPGSFRWSGMGVPTTSISRSRTGERSSRPTAGGGTTIRPTTRVTTRSGVSPADTGSSSCSPPGPRSRVESVTSSPTSLQLWSRIRLA